MDAVVATAVALVNALTEGERRGRPYRLTDPPAIATQVLGVPVDAPGAEELIAIAHELRIVFEATAAGDLDTAAGQLNKLLEQTHAQPRLSHHNGEPWHMHFHGLGDSLSAQWAAPCATGLAVVLGSDLHDRLGVCTAPHCDRVYVDTSRNGTRRFCSTACQNRVKTAAFRARTQT